MKDGEAEHKKHKEKVLIPYPGADKGVIKIIRRKIFFRDIAFYLDLGCISHRHSPCIVF